MKKLFLTLILGCFALVGFSQARFDVKVGMSMTNITDSEGDMKVGYTVGLGIDYPINTNWAFQSGVMFTGKGAKYGDYKLNATYLDIPLLAAFRAPIANDVNFVANAGPYLSCGIAGKDDYFTEDGLDAKRFDLGLQFGVGAEFGDILLNLTGQYGFINRYEVGDCKNVGFYITAGYRF
ncbi:porin family protein [uncultured Bacteroides sp.]|uniref:porin family protein n=1 Tax=uncultured Bacteroides sp. TaxID=162156 RepID=UPI00261B38F8|nr:porin family protein [uncultured Bacteroides sp.]